MKNLVKAVIIKGVKTFSKDKVLTLQLDGRNYDEVKQFVILRKLGVGSPVQLQLKDKESKSAEQNRTYRLLLQIALQSDLFGINYNQLHKCFKQAYGVIDAYQDFNGKWQTTLKSTADYTMPEMAKLITGTIDFMLTKFNEANYYDKRFDDMLQEFNTNKQVEAVKKVFQEF